MVHFYIPCPITCNIFIFMINEVYVQFWKHAYVYRYVRLCVCMHVYVMRMCIYTCERDK